MSDNDPCQEGDNSSQYSTNLQQLNDQYQLAQEQLQLQQQIIIEQADQNQNQNKSSPKRTKRFKEIQKECRFCKKPFVIKDLFRYIVCNVHLCESCHCIFMQKLIEETQSKQEFILKQQSILKQIVVFFDTPPPSKGLVCILCLKHFANKEVKKHFTLGYAKKFYQICCNECFLDNMNKRSAFQTQRSIYLQKRRNFLQYRSDKSTTINKFNDANLKLCKMCGLYKSEIDYGLDLTMGLSRRSSSFEGGTIAFRQDCHSCYIQIVQSIKIRQCSYKRQNSNANIIPNHSNAVQENENENENLNELLEGSNDDNNNTTTNDYEQVSILRTQTYKQFMKSQCKTCKKVFIGYDEIQKNIPYILKDKNQNIIDQTGKNFQQILIEQKLSSKNLKTHNNCNACYNKIHKQILLRKVGKTHMCHLCHLFSRANHTFVNKFYMCSYCVEEDRLHMPVQKKYPENFARLKKKAFSESIILYKKGSKVQKYQQKISFLQLAREFKENCEKKLQKYQMMFIGKRCYDCKKFYENVRDNFLLEQRPLSIDGKKMEYKPYDDHAYRNICHICRAKNNLYGKQKCNMCNVVYPDPSKSFLLNLPYVCKRQKYIHTCKVCCLKILNKNKEENALSSMEFKCFRCATKFIPRVKQKQTMFCLTCQNQLLRGMKLQGRKPQTSRLKFDPRQNQDFTLEALSLQKSGPTDKRIHSLTSDENTKWMLQLNKAEFQKHTMFKSSKTRMAELKAKQQECLDKEQQEKVAGGKKCLICDEFTSWADIPKNFRTYKLKMPGTGNRALYSNHCINCRSQRKTRSHLIDKMSKMLSQGINIMQLLQQ